MKSNNKKEEEEGEDDQAAGAMTASVSINVRPYWQFGTSTLLKDPSHRETSH